MRSGLGSSAILLAIVLAGVPSPNPHLRILIESIRSDNYTNVDSYWDKYITSIRDDRLYSENIENFWGLDGIKEHEVKLAERQMTEAEFCHQIGMQFARQAMARESNWFLAKAESLGYVNTATYFARADNSAREWNNNLHYNEDPLDPGLQVYENNWRENLTKVINTSKDSIDVYRAHLELTCIYSPARNSLYIDSFAPMTIENLEKFINDYPSNPLIESAYERLVWWLSTAKSYSELGGVCRYFLGKYPDSRIAEYIKFQLGNAYYFTGVFEEAKPAYLSIDKTSLPDFVYPGWAGHYIVETIENRLSELESEN